MDPLRLPSLATTFLMKGPTILLMSLLMTQPTTQIIRPHTILAMDLGLATSHLHSSLATNLHTGPG